MSNDEQGYNGWKNYETWSVALIINNDQGLQEGSFEVTRQALEGADWPSVADSGTYQVAEALKDWVQRASEIESVVDEYQPWSFLWSQLISAALSEVDWYELAQHWIADLEEVEA